MPYIPSITLPAFVFETPAVSILLPIGGGFGIGYLTNSKVREDYKALKLPPFSPPGWLFAPVWSVLYPLMGYAAYRAWDVGMSSLDPSVVEATKQGATLYTIQLALNLSSAAMLPGYRQPVASSAVVVALLGSIGALILKWGKVDPIASYCLLPYISWVSLATYLTLGINYLNSWSKGGTKQGRNPSDDTPKTR